MENQVKLNHLLPKTSVKLKWKTVVLTDSNISTKAPSVDLSETLDFNEALSSLTKDAGFFTHIEIINILKKTHQTENLIKVFGYNNVSYIKDLCTKANLLPSEFKAWASEKNLGPKDLRSFIKDYTKELHQPLLKKVAELNPSKSSGLLILEYSLDLLYGKKTEVEDLLKFKQPNSLLSYLKKLRFQNTFEKDSELNQKMKKLDLGENIKISSQREGDQQKVILNVKAISAESILKSLKKIEDKIPELTKMWTNI